MSLGDEIIPTQLNTLERKAVTNAIAYYKDHLIEKSLTRGLSKERVWLQHLYPKKKITDTALTKGYTTILNDFSEVYGKYLWPIHKAHNATILDLHHSTIKDMETRVIPKMERLSLNNWPAEARVRIDITTYANYAGAYTVTKPFFNTIISTIDPSSKETLFVETVFHEGSHLLFRYGSPFRDAIYGTAEEMKITFPKNLWHAALFYLCGRVVQDELEKKAIDHEMIMDVKNIFTGYNTPEFRNTLEQYYGGVHDFDTCISTLVNSFK